MIHTTILSKFISIMTNVVNNTDLDKVAQTIANGKKDKQSLRKPVKLQGEWSLDPSKGCQFRTELSYEKGKELIEIDSPSFLGGNGNRLGPMAYCVAGITSCFIATFAIENRVAKMMDSPYHPYSDTRFTINEKGADDIEEEVNNNSAW
jgi:hypothetical protein